MHEVEQETDGVQDVSCRNCGAPARVDLEKTPDWFCAECDTWQDTMACPVCHQPARISLFPEMVGGAVRAHTDKAPEEI